METKQFKGIPDQKPKVNLFFNWYETPTRQHEIDRCLAMNKKVFDQVVLVEGRPTFTELFQKSKEFPNDINCFCNSDIYFTSTELLHTIKPNECYALTRDDLRHTEHARGSQDAWIFRGEVRPIKANFHSAWGSDNHVAWLIKNAKYDIKNPCLSIEIVHLHKEDNRDYARTAHNTIPPPYLTLNPVAL